MKIERHHSAGGLVVRTAPDGAPGSAEILLISTREGKRWQLPKGHLEAGETSQQAAVRETREETGVTGRVLAGLPAVEYWFNERGVRIHKRVDYYLLAYVDGDPANYDRKEVSGAAWFPWSEGLARLTFANERRVVEAARTLESATAEEPRR